MPTKKKKKKKKNQSLLYMMIVMAALAVVSAAVMTYTYMNGGNASSENETTEPEPSDALTDYGSFVLSEGALRYPLLPTDIRGLLVELDPGGVFTFYEYADGRLNRYQNVKTVSVSVECSRQNIPATVYYAEKDGRLTGFGLFTTAISGANVKLYDYAFFKAVTAPDGYGKNRALLLVDFDKDDFASDNKAYSEIFSWNPDSGKADKLTSENGRTVDELGRMRTDWAVITDQLLKSCGGKRLYLSGRNYNLNNLDRICDALVIPDSASAPQKAVTGITGAYLKVTDGGNTLVFLRETGRDSFAAFKKSNGTETAVKEFEGRLPDYLMCGDFLLHKETLVLTEISSGMEAKLKVEVKSPVSFSISPDGRKLVIFGGGAQQTAVFYDLSTGESEASREDNIFSAEYTQIIWLQNDVFAAMAVQDGSLVYRVCKF
ncbi:MAG: hypothetical protein FWF05_06360 [Oscillospiraceae bacterium]|nr:hypothetical protein [Oscillospiraceae bacterium]